jgi:hypothetical protein
MTDVLEDTIASVDATDVEMADEQTEAVPAGVVDDDDEPPTTHNDEPPPRLMITKMVRSVKLVFIIDS